MRLFAVVRIEREALNHQSILKEIYIYIVMCLEAFHVAFDGDQSLLFSNKVQLFNSSGQHFRVDFFWQIVAIRRAIEFELLLQSFLVEGAFSLAAFATNPFQAVVGKKFQHFFVLLFEAVSFFNNIRQSLLCLIASQCF